MGFFSTSVLSAAASFWFEINCWDMLSKFLMMSSDTIPGAGLEASLLVVAGEFELLLVGTLACTSWEEVAEKYPFSPDKKLRRFICVLIQFCWCLISFLSCCNVVSELSSVGLIVGVAADVTLGSLNWDIDKFSTFFEPLVTGSSNVWSNPPSPLDSWSSGKMARLSSMPSSSAVLLGALYWRLSMP